ncbi:tyrosine-protein kinase Etk/Wzc [Pseudoxanthomonas sp. GM95]|uniref:polysaccharide biosynthesis tyrosine autokinase n=1 Tax=Pseudoxanthomonas sp. GM95 TaxID=1881043 RepID=UPI0008D247ED|nr:polysaccharide biosynthesis tyrosine autokinase [Pseudoxanthomonas sp. GM95]SEM44854.1 tyrosine-protein kinase Etk/Wzc [Pseudoxanthomonas sp. GM95]
MSNDPTAGMSRDEDEIDLRQLLGVLVDHKWWIVGIIAMFFLASVAYAVIATPIFRAQAMVQVESTAPTIPGLSDLSSLGVETSSSQATTEIALITSRAVVGTAVDKLKLETQADAKRFPVLGDFLARRFKPATEGALAAPVFGLRQYGWGGERIEIERLTVPDAMRDARMRLEVGTAPGSFILQDGVGRLLLRGKVGEPASGHGVNLLVAALAANPGTQFNVTQRRRLNVVTSMQGQVKVLEQGKESGILQLTYENRDPAFAGAFLQDVAEAYVRQNVDRNSAEASSQLQFVRDQLPEVRKQVEAAQAKMNAYQTKANSVDITLQTKGLLEQQVAVETSIQQLHMQQAEMDRSFTKEHPAYRALMRQIGELEGRKAGFNKQVGELPDTQQELLRLTRDLQVSNELYTALLNQAQQLDVARAGTVGNVRIIDAAAVDSTSPVKPRRLLIVMAGTLFGGLVAVGLVFLRRVLNPGIEEPSQLEDLGLPVYAAIPLSDVKEVQDFANSKRRRRTGGGSRHHLLAVNAPTDLAVEAIRSLRTSLHFAMLEAKNNILMISGPRPGVGKTFVSANLAAVVAQAGQRVLVIDADMRKGALHKVLDVVPGVGLSDVLVGKAQAIAVIRPLQNVPNMYYMTRGDIPPNPSELLMHPRFTELMNSLSSQYDLVIIDTPPILAVTDAGIVGQHAGSSLLVTRFGLNQPKEVLLTKKRFQQSGVYLKGAIFNAVEKRATGFYSYGYYEYKPSGAS